MPDAIFVAIETTGEPQVNAHRRVQMMLFEARQKTFEEMALALPKNRKQMLAVRGMGETRFTLYGRAFLDAIQAWDG